MLKILAFLMLLTTLGACGASVKTSGKSADVMGGEHAEEEKNLPVFEADSALAYVAKQVSFGPRVPNTPAHERTAEWLAAELQRHGAEVTLQKADLKAFDGTILHSTNIMGSYNADKDDRLLLLAHYDTRPWADADPNPANHSKPIEGANDGASGVGVLLELARIFAAYDPGKGIDILFVDSEDYGTDGQEESWALGARYFAQNPIKDGYRASGAILLDMVGDKEAVFPAEYFSRKSAPALDDAIRTAAAKAGHGDRFPYVMGSAVTDDHVELINAGIPAIDIIDYRIGRGFAPTWHTLDDNLSNIDKETLRSVGETLVKYIYD